MSEQIKKYSYYFLIIAIILAGFVLRLNLLLDNPSFWFDESALGYNVLSLSFFRLFGILHLQQVAPPLFLAAAKIFVNTFGSGDLILRLFPFVVGNLSIILFFFILKEYFKDKPTIISGLLLFCFNIQLLKYSAEFKPYIVEMFSTCLILYIFKRINFEQTYKKLFAIGCALAVLPWFSFVSAVLIAIAYLITFSKKNLKKWFIAFLPFFVSEIFILIYYLKIKFFYSEFMSDFFVNDFFTLKEFPIQLTIGFSYLFSINHAFIPLLIFLCGIICCFVDKKQLFLRNFSLFSFITFISLSFLKIYPFYDRFIIFLLPVILMMNLIIIEKCCTMKNIFVKFLVTIYVLFMFFPTFVYMQKINNENFTKRSCARELTQDMASKIKQDDIIIVDTLSTPDFLYYGRYYNFRNEVFMNIKEKNGIILYKMNRNEELPLNKGAFYWLYSPWSSRTYDYVKYDYQKNCKYGGKILYINGGKQ